MSAIGAFGHVMLLPIAFSVETEQNECTAHQDGRSERAMYKPEELSFAPLYRCNFKCAHCIIRAAGWSRREKLPISTALGLLSQAWDVGIRSVSFTGGEPFLYPEFLFQVSREAARIGFEFAQIMTNGCWWNSVDRMRAVLRELKECGYSGAFGMSVDDYHADGPTQHRVAFIRACIEGFGGGCVFLSYTSGRPGEGLGLMRDLAVALGGTFEVDESGSGAIAGDGYEVTFGHNRLFCRDGHGRTQDGGRSGGFSDDDYRGMHQAVYVGPNGDVRPCFGYATSEKLTIGNVGRHRLVEIIAKANADPYIGFVYRHGLTELRRRLESAGRSPVTTPTDFCCHFCQAVLDGACWPPDT